MHVRLIKGLIVRGSEEFGPTCKLEEIRLPETFSQEKLPMDREDVPTEETLAEWDYLKEVGQTRARYKRYPVGAVDWEQLPKSSGTNASDS